MAFVYWIHLPEHTDMFSEGYIGFTSKEVSVRYKEHLKHSKRKVGKNIVHKAISKYESSIVVDTLVEGSDEYCLYLEEKFRPTEFVGWNMAVGGAAPMLGRKRTQESKNNQSKSQLAANFKHTEETKLLIGKSKIGKPRSQDLKDKVSLANKGRKLSSAHKEAISSFNKGKIVSDETRAKLSSLFKGRPFTEDARAANTAYLKSLRPWENNAAKKSRPAWLLADSIWEYMQDFPDFGSRKIAKEFKMPLGHVERIHKAIRNGWNPTQDLDWLSFYMKESENV